MVRSPADPNGEPEYVFDENKSKNEEWAEIVRFEEPKPEPRYCRKHRLPGFIRDAGFDVGSVIHVKCCDSYWRAYAIGSFGIAEWEQVAWVANELNGESAWQPVKTKLGFRVKNR